MTSSVDTLVRAVDEGIIEPDDIDEDLFNHCLWSSESSEPDLLVRTSGEIRLSDFLLWQSPKTVLSFTPVLWPEFSLWHLIRAIFYYQRHEPEVRIEKKKKMELNERKERLKEKINIMRRKEETKRKNLEVK